MNTSEKQLKVIKIILAIFLIILIAYLLKTLAFLFIPLAFAAFLTLIILPIMQRLKKRKVPYFISLILIFVVVGLGVQGISWIIQDTAKQIVSESDKISIQFKQKIDPVIKSAEAWTGVEIIEDESNFVKNNIETLVTSKGFGSAVKYSLGTAKNLLQAFFITMFFFFLMLSSTLRYKEKIEKFSQGKKNNYLQIFEELVKALGVFLRVKTVVSLGTGIGFTIICYIFGVDFPIFWGFLTFIINYVQLLGSVISTIIVSIFGFLQIDTMAGFALFSALLAATQVLFGSILEPIFMGKSFSINTVFIIISLFIWGYLWGVSGMILSIPILTLIKIILDYSENYQILGSMLGEKKHLINVEKMGAKFGNKEEKE